MTDLEAIAKDAAERVHKNGGCVPQIAFAPILFALQDAFPAPVAETAGEAVARDKLVAGLADALAFIDDMGTDLHHARVADWYPEGAHNAASQMSEDMRLAGNRCAAYEPLVDLNEAIAASPVPAQDDDKLRIAVEALAKWEEFNAYRKSDPLALRFEFETEEDRLAAANALDEVFAALKSTAAQEGGAK